MQSQRPEMSSAIVKMAEDLMSVGLYDPQALFQVIYPQTHKVHYSTVRRAIHLAKTR